MSVLDQLRRRQQLREQIEAAREEQIRLEQERPARAAAAFQERTAVEEPPEPPARARSMQEKLEARSQAISRTSNPAAFNEVDRICALPIARELTREEFEDFNRRHVLAEHFERGWRYFGAQAGAIKSFQDMGGLFGPIGVGFGKTLVTIKIADLAYRDGVTKSLLLVPSQVFVQLVRKDLGWARRHVPISVPFHPMGGKVLRERLALAKSGKAGCYILPYSCLSTKDTTDVLEAIDAGLVICDEAHLVKNRQAARTKRLLEFCHRRRPKFVALSGTITSKSVLDYHHLIKLALGNGSPLPQSPVMAAEWAAVLDSAANPSHAQSGPLRPLVDWARHGFPDEPLPLDVSGFRRSYRLRLTSTPGVVATGDTEIGTSLVLANEPVEDYKAAEGWEDLEHLVDRVVNEWVTPTGDEIEHAIHTWKWLFELSSGFYNKLYWPSEAEIALKRSVSEDKARDLLEGAMRHHAAGQAYARELRSWLEQHARPKLDTPMAVGFDMSRNGNQNVSAELYDKWREWRSLEFEGMPERDSTAVRVCDFKVRQAVEWAKGLKKPGALVWCYHQEVARWVYEEMVAAGIDALHCPAGDRGNKAIL
ncbi:MAG: DEAD/DEAH box helicase family protein, partial [Planctomycetota bacterium JB042]